MAETSQERALLVGVQVTRGAPSGAPAAGVSAEESLDELEALAKGAGAEVVGRVLQVRPALEPATLVGSGKIEELKQIAGAGGVDVIMVDHDLTPTQLRNLEHRLKRRVVDRTQLILDIFASRARTREGQLQVELAQLSYMLPRLSGRGVEMSRLGGGIGTRGPGETQLETDRRRIARRIQKIKQQLETVRRTRTVQRRQRRGVPLANLAMVGYTNAGKSTLFNRLTGADVTADARMFATLDPTARLVVLGSRRRVVLSDTVGFIRNLPTTLVQAFRATLEEVVEASLLLHVVDASSEHAEQHGAHVFEVLNEIGAQEVPQILVLNKADRLPGDIDAEAMLRRMLAELGSGDSRVSPWQRAVAVSAKTGGGVEQLLRTIDEVLPEDPVVRVLFRMPAGAGGDIHLLHEFAKVVHSRYDEDVCEIDAEVPESLLRRLEEYVVEKAGNAGSG